MSPQLDDIAFRAKAQPAARFTALAHHLAAELLEDTWQSLNHRGAPGLSGETMETYGRQRRRRIAALVSRLKDHAYRVPPVRRVYIPKPDSRRRDGPSAYWRWRTACYKRRSSTC